MIEQLFKLSEHKTTVRTEVLAGLTTFLTMAYIISVQPAVLSGKMFGTDTGMDFGAVTTATCLSAARWRRRSWRYTRIIPSHRLRSWVTIYFLFFRTFA